MSQANRRSKGRPIIEQPKLPKQRSMEMLPPEEDGEDIRPSSASSTSSSRPSSSSSRRAPPVNGQERIPRTPTPTKSVLLEAVKRKEESPLLNKKEKENQKPNIKSQSKKPESNKKNSSDEYDTDLENERNEKRPSPSPEPIKAPNELMMEFLDCMMTKDYANAHKLCKMILLYEPSNQQALQFHPLLEEKIRQQEELDGDTGSGDDTSSEGSDEDEGSTDDEGVELTSSDGSSSSSDEDEDEDEEEDEDRSTIQDEHKV